MKTRKLGNLEVSEIGMGCMGFSHGYGQIPEESYSIDAIRAAIDYGCNFLDTAEVYGKQLFYEGHNEEIVGKAVEGIRNNIIIATKLYLNPEELTENTPIKEAIRKHLIKSMKALRTDYVDLYYLHRINEDVPYTEVAEAMGQLRNEGLIREWGMSQVSVTQLAKANEVSHVAAVQNLYSMVERDCENEIFPYCIENDITVVPFSPIASGLLSGKIKADTQFEKVDDVRNFVPQLQRENILGNQPIIDLVTEYAKKKDATPAQISLAWMLHKYPNVVPIPGSKNKERILENLHASEVCLTDDEFEALESTLNTLPVYGHRGHVETDKITFAKWAKNK